jgi:hydroxyacylglutathione hydrolase
MMKETVDTLANQKIINYALNGSLNKEDFIKELTHDLPNPPVYFPSNVKLNQEGYLDFDKVLEKSLKELSLDKFKMLMQNDNTVVLDVRNQNLFKQGFVPGSIFIGLNGSFAPWVGSVIKEIDTKILLISEKDKEQEAIIRLSRVGFDNCLGFLDGGFDVWKNSDNQFDSVDSISAKDLNKIIGSISLIDVRKNGERNNGYLNESINIPLDDFTDDVLEIDKMDKHFIHCAGGYRSMIAASLLKRNGFKSIVDVSGGFAAIRKENFNILEKTCIN